MKLALAVLLLTSVFANSAMAKGIVCSLDGRPVDGVLRVIELAPNASGRFDVVETVEADGRGSGSSKTVTKLATNLECNIDGLIAYCIKGSNEENESQNSIAEFSLVQKTVIYTLQQPKAAKAKPTIDIRVMSPYVTKTEGSFYKDFSFAVKTQFGGCKAR